MAYVLIDVLIFGAVVLIVPILAFVGGFLGYRARVGYVARTIGGALRKGNPLLFLEGHDRKLRLIPMESGITGYWHHAHVEQIPDEAGTYNFYGTEAGIAASQAVSNINPEFNRYVAAFRKAQKEGKLKGVTLGGNGMEDVLGREIGSSPEELARALYELEEEKRAVEKRILFLEQVNADQTTVEEIIRKEKFDKNEAGLFRTEMTAALSDLTQPPAGLNDEQRKKWKAQPGATLRARLDKINAARKITVQEEGFQIVPDGKNRYKLVRNALLTLDEFWHFLPTGSNINNVWTMVKRAKEQNKLESGFDEGKGFKWLIIGIVVMMVTIGTGVMVYLITKA